ncbi:hypothetical protein Fmac_028839 [Flemingia macrophylla]|uniref:Polygalacturonase n=1 Tax=Flemingia macrophylla TaxID=520843 RepID=A0ABD1L8M9_9FABA
MVVGREYFRVTIKPYNDSSTPKTMKWKQQRNLGDTNGGKWIEKGRAFSEAWQKVCGTQGINTLLIPSGRVFMVKNIGLNGTCMATSINVQLQGKIVAPARDAWGSGSNLIIFHKVNGLTIDGTGGLIDGYGSTWWKCNHCARPTLLTFESCNNLRVGNLTTSNSPKAHIHVNECMGVIFSYISISAPGNSPNTDGFDVYNSRYINIEDSIIATGKPSDDCIAISGDSSFINATRIACGPGHGISIGSLGRNNARNIVEEVHVRNCSFTNTTNGARIKTWATGSGYARKITFEQINLMQTRNPIIINQHYIDYDDLAEEGGGGVRVSEVIYRGFQGTSWNDKAITFNCSSSGCHNIVLDEINIASSEPGNPRLSGQPLSLFQPAHPQRHCFDEKALFRHPPSLDSISIFQPSKRLIQHFHTLFHSPKNPQLFSFKQHKRSILKHQFLRHEATTAAASCNSCMQVVSSGIKWTCMRKTWQHLSKDLEIKSL